MEMNEQKALLLATRDALKEQTEAVQNLYDNVEKINDFDVVLVKLVRAGRGVEELIEAKGGEYLIRLNNGEKIK